MNCNCFEYWIDAGLWAAIGCAVFGISENLYVLWRMKRAKKGPSHD